VIADWAERHGHEVVLVVTPPPGGGADGDSSLVESVSAESSLLVTGELRSVAAPTIASLGADLVVSVGFPLLIPPEILAIPTYGALTVLSAGRGPNPFRSIYEGATTLGATLYRTERDCDTDVILSRRERPLPEDVTGPALRAIWLELLAEVLDEGAARAIAADPGTAQDGGEVFRAATFTEAEKLLDLGDPAATVRRKAAALTALTPQARIQIGDTEVTVRDVREAASGRPDAAPGNVLDKHPDGWTVQTADRPVRIFTE
jgi:methionyl-tRNA formyltransferase